MRERLTALDAPVPRFAGVSRVAELDSVDEFAGRVGGPVVVKAVRGGMTAAGCGWPTTWLRPERPRGLFGCRVPVLVEERVELRRELAALVARSPFGQGAAWRWCRPCSATAFAWR
ncbi:ATP-grasp domain protein [Mycobacterium xenopi 4042]|uniref:ATP-grasp domain protein n=1 Tax=Mycobacterium xenopi 4042 TaxID=1299334 RepID=X7YJK5_MYCXE|nr:ATP-grasp domain protein [Mycobacterium xenopi 4042]